MNVFGSKFTSCNELSINSNRQKVFFKSTFRLIDFTQAQTYFFVTVEQFKIYFKFSDNLIKSFLLEGFLFGVNSSGLS